MAIVNPSTYLPTQTGASVDQSASARYQARSRIPNLDGLRGLAILLVLFHHVPDVSTMPWLAQLQGHGKHGVSLFFVISGYIVTMLLLREWRRRDAVDIRAFLIRRALRLFPLYYAVLLLEAVLVFGLDAYSAENRQLFTDKLPCYALYCSNWLENSGQGPFFVSWSLAAEEQFYLMLALLLIVVRPASLAGIFLGLLGLKLALTLAWPGFDHAALPWRILFSYSEAIILGVLLALLLDQPRGFLAIRDTLGSPLAAGLLFVLFTALLIFADLHDKTSTGALLLYLVCALLVASCVVQDHLPALGHGALPWMGALSYGIYLLHMPVLSAVKRLSDEPAAILFISLLVVLPMAWFSFRFFEEPLRRRYRPRS